MTNRFLEALEMRRLLNAAFASLNTRGTLSVVGTIRGDTIRITRQAGRITASRNGSFLSFATANVRRIWADGFGGNDRIDNQTSLPSTLLGASGNDTLAGGRGSDLLDGGAGKNVADYSARNMAISGVLGWDGDSGKTIGRVQPLRGGAERDRLFSLSRLIGGSGNDSLSVQYDLGSRSNGFAYPAEPYEIDGGPGNDNFQARAPGGLLAEVLFNGGDGNDSFYFSSQAFETLLGGAGNDRFYNDLTGYDQENFAVMEGGPGHDELDYYGDEALNVTIPPGIEDFIGGGVYSVTGNDLNNLIKIVYPSDAGANISVYARGGNDRIEYDIPNNPFESTLTLSGGSGNDTIFGSNGSDQLLGDGGKDVIYAADHQRDTIDGGAGFDKAKPSLDKNGKITDVLTSIEAIVD